MATPTQLNDRDDAHQLLWDFVYGLLDEIDATELRRRISSDPDVARMYIETKMQVALVAEAARFQHPPIRLADSAEPGDSSLADEPTPLAPIGLRRRQSRTSSELSTASKWRWLNVVICAATILLVLGVGFFYLRPASLIRMRAVENHQKQLRQDHIYSYVIQPERLHPGIDNKITVQTVSMNENPQAAEIEYRLLDDNKKPQFQLVGKTDKHGRLHLEVPGGAVARGSEFELVTKQRYGATTIRGPINVDATGESVYLSIDRPVYRQGDVLRFRGVVLSRFGLRVRRQKGIEFDIRDAKGRFIPRSLHAGVTRRGVGYGEFVLPRELPVGRYELCARSASQEFQEQRQAFYVRKRNKDRLQKQLEFTRRNYSPGDPVVADFSVHQSNGRPLKNAPLDVRVRVDGTVVHRESHVSDSYGTCQIRFSLPEDIKAGSADLSVEIEQPSFREQLIRSIPIRLQRVRLEFFPEGGELVAGIPSRVYFRATDSLGRPIQVSGELLDAKGKIQAIFESAHQGRGRFGLTPAVAADSRPYTIRLTGTSATLVAEVPDVSSQSFLVVTANPGIAEPMRPLELTIRSSRKKAAIGISASCRGVTVGQTTVAINQTPKEANGASYVTETVRVPLADEASGIVRVTLFDYSVSPPLPVAERLVFRRPQKKLITKIFRPSAFLPTRRAQIDLQITDEQRRPVESAVLGVTVVDRAVWRQGRQRPQDIASHFLLHNELNSRLDLATEVKYLAHSASSNENLDLLLGTKGWRRFVHDPTPEDLLASSIQRENRTSAPIVYINRNRVHSTLVSALDGFQSHRESNIQQVGWVIAVAATGLLLLVVIQMIMVRVSQRYIRAPILTTGFLCLVLGICWAGARVNSDGSLQLFARFSAQPETNDSARYASIGKGPTIDKPGPPTPPVARQTAVSARSAHSSDFETTQVFEQLLGHSAVPVTSRRRPNPKPFTANQVQTSNLGRMQEQLRKAIMAADEQRIIDLSTRIKQTIDRNQFPLRQYAHRYDNSQHSQHADQTQTLYWNPLVLTDKQGRATIAFDLSELTGSWLVLIDGHADGRLASAETEIDSQLPFQMTSVVPSHVTIGDKFEIPIQVNNETEQALRVRLSTKMPHWFDQKGGSSDTLQLKVAGRQTRYRTVQVLGQTATDKALVEIHGASPRNRQRIRRQVNVIPLGYPHHKTISGSFSGRQDIVFSSPRQILPNSLRLNLTVYPTFQSAMQRDAASLALQPNAGFEGIAAAGYTQSEAIASREARDLASPQQTKAEKQQLQNYYQRLLSHEHPEQGFFAFRANKRHPVYTAYGLLHLHDMRRVWNVDPRILNRNANWLFGQRNQDGRFYNSTSQPSTSAVPSEHGNAFILWVLSEMRPDGLNVDRQLGQVVKAAEDSMDPYLLALAAVSASNFERRDDANKLIKQLASKQHADGYVVARGGTITLSGGASMKVETTALAAMAWMKNASTRENARKALRWITTQRKPQGGFGSSQATALALRAMSQFQRASNKAVPYMGWAELFSRGNQIARQRIRSDQREPVMFVLSARDLSPGDQQLTLKASGPNGSVLRELSYTFHMRYNTERPAKTPEPSPVQLSTRLSKEKVRIGQSVELHATVKNTSADAQPMTVARIGLPGGLVADSKKLEVMRRDGLFDHFELDKQGLVLVWESIPGGDDEAKKTRTLKIPLEAKIAGQFTGAPSQCFLNYHREVFHWAPTLKVTVVK